MPEFCAAGTRALQRYGDISGEGSETSPEHLMPVLIFNFLANAQFSGYELSMTLESSFSTIWQWHIDAIGRKQETIPIDLMILGKELGSQKVDMVLFDGPTGTPKQTHDFLALVEFKKGNLEAINRDGKPDRQKILGLLKHITTCRYGIVCGWTKDKHYSYQQEQAVRVQDLWFSKRLNRNSPYWFCARVFGRTE